MKKIISIMVMVFCTTFAQSAFANKGDLAKAESERVRREGLHLQKGNAYQPAPAPTLLPYQIANGSKVRCRDGTWCDKEVARAERGDVGMAQNNKGPCSGLTGNELRMCQKASTILPSIGGMFGR